ncbi:hypothetical protein [Vulcanisaeta sp. JCM 16159]|uniref:hypothetical protein n=1 Tax=Vulcanisaeta sp. JCM 16159 TaxID=1295371 RepID=UPI000A6E253A|nr:hypothetical protein [Vulcanisaeta sp. JCM 16159]
MSYQDCIISLGKYSNVILDLLESVIEELEGINTLEDLKPAITKAAVTLWLGIMKPCQ